MNSKITRRHFVKITSLVGVSSFTADPGWAGSGALEAYASGTSVRQGGSISFHARNPLGSRTKDKNFTMTVVKLGVPDQNMLTATVSLRDRVVPANASSDGCGWPAEYVLNVPVTWPSGLYYATFGAGVQVCCVPFVIRPASGTVAEKVLVQIPVTTAQAYNSYGGKSLYAYNSTAEVPATNVSFDRPHTDPSNLAFDPWQAPFVRWLAKNRISADFCTSIDLHQDALLLNGYQLFLTAGHDEYWSRAMRSKLDAFVAAGGNAAIFSGNTCWWQIRLEANVSGVANRSLVCYKSRTTDPDTRAAFKTTNWIDLVPPEPENSTIGLGWNLGASWTNAFARPDTPYVVHRSEHWVFDGTGFSRGGRFGGSYSGYETDALAFRTGTDGHVYPTAVDKAPSTLRILALADASTWDAQAKALGLGGEKSGYAAISIHSRGGAAGAVFNGGTIDWATALQPELDGQIATPFSRMTLNVVTRLSGRHLESADVKRWHNIQTSGDGARYFFTVGVDSPVGAILDGVAFRAFAESTPNATPVYRYRYPQVNGDGDRYIYSMNANLGYGWLGDGIAFHAFATNLVGTAAVYQHHAVQANGDGWRFFYSLNLIESGWTFDGVAFFVPAT